MAPTKPPTTSSGPVELRFRARAGLLPELSGQTYDSLYKALREVVMNSADAAASEISIDFSHTARTGVLIVNDDGAGMSLAEVRDRFLSVGGSNRYGDRSTFGRIGIGSLALLRYGDSARLITKTAGSKTQVTATLRHPGQMSGGDRQEDLSSVIAGTAEELVYDGPASDHFTRIELVEVNEDVWRAAADPNEFFALLEALQRVLPLPWTEAGAWRELCETAPTVVDAVRREVGDWSIPAVITSEWGEQIRLQRRHFGDGRGTALETVDAVVPVEKELQVVDGNETRKIRVAGFLGAQSKPVSDWSGITARVQNVAIETSTFFGVTSDPGFRKYVTGDLYFFGDLDTSRLINIDRSSFNQESADYRAIQDFMADVVQRFKSEYIQRPQRAKVIARKIIESETRTMLAMQQVIDAAFSQFGGEHRRLPSSGIRRFWDATTSPVTHRLEASGVTVVSRPGLATAAKPYRLRRLAKDQVEAEIAPAIVEPTLCFGVAEYRVAYAAGGQTDPPVVIRNRPKEIVFNTGHPLNHANGTPAKFSTSLAMELAMAFSSVSWDLDPHETAIQLLVHA